MTASNDALLDDLLAGKHRALARVITLIENRSPGYRDLVSALYEHTGNAEVIGITGSPGAGKSTLVDKLAKTYRDRGLTVGVIGIDPASPFTGGAVLGDRIRMGSTSSDMDVFFRSMSARGSLGGLSIATADAVKALDAFGKDKVIIETVGAGQNEIDIVKTADTVAVLVPPQSGDAVQMLKAGILEIGDVFVVNKADLDGVDKIVRDLREMLQQGGDQIGSVRRASVESEDSAERWTPEIIETVSTKGEGIEELIGVFDDHAMFLEETGLKDLKDRTRIGEELRTLLREDSNRLVEQEIQTRSGMDSLIDQVQSGETDPYRLADSILSPIFSAYEERSRPTPDPE